jgi:hypothetical protein
VLPENDWRSVPIQQFQAWVEFLAKRTRPFYGWAGRGNRASMRDWPPSRVLVEGSAIAAFKPQPVEWLNFLGPAYVEHLGRDALLAAPVTRIEPRPDGGLLVQRFQDPTSIDLRGTTWPQLLAAD